MDDKERAKRFREAREKHNKNGYESMDTVGQNLAVNVPKSTIQKLENENDSTNVGYKTIVNLAEHYGINVAYLMGQPGSSPSLDESSQAVTKATGLSAEAVEAIRSLMPNELACLDALLTSYSFKRTLLMLSQAKTISKHIEEWAPTKSMQDDPSAPQTADEYADMIEKANLFEINYDHRYDSKAWFPIGTGSTISDRQLVKMYRTEALQDIGNAFREIAPADESERKE